MLSRVYTSYILHLTFARANDFSRGNLERDWCIGILDIEPLPFKKGRLQAIHVVIFMDDEFLPFFHTSRSYYVLSRRDDPRELESFLLARYA